MIYVYGTSPPPSETLEVQELLEILERAQSVEKQRESDHVLEILGILEILEVVEILSEKNLLEQPLSVPDLMWLPTKTPESLRELRRALLQEFRELFQEWPCHSKSFFFNWGDSQASENT